MEIFVADINDIYLEKEYCEAFDLLKVDQQDKVNRFRFIADKKRCMLGILMLRYGLQKLYGIYLEDIDIVKNEYGKPSLKQVENIHFNISHSGDYVVCAIGDEPVGIDVQEMTKVSYSIVERFFAPEEKQVFDTLDEDEKIDFFFGTWTLKEAYVKLLGKGLYQPFDKFGIVKENGKYCLFLNGKENHDTHFKEYRLDKGYRLSICMEKESFPERLISVSCRDMLSY